MEEVSVKPYEDGGTEDIADAVKSQQRSRVGKERIQEGFRERKEMGYREREREMGGSSQP